MATAIKLLGQGSVDYSKFYNKVMKVDGYDEVILGSIFYYLVENKKFGKAFTVKSANLQIVWIYKFLSKEHNQWYIILSSVAKRSIFVLSFDFIIVDNLRLFIVRILVGQFYVSSSYV